MKHDKLGHTHENNHGCILYTIIFVVCAVLGAAILYMIG